MPLSPAGTTHLVTRLERDGMVRREVDPADRRKWFTVLTPEGDRTLSEARRTHNDVLRRTLFSATSTTNDARCNASGNGSPIGNAIGAKHLRQAPASPRVGGHGDRGRSGRESLVDGSAACVVEPWPRWAPYGSDALSA